MGNGLVARRLAPKIQNTPREIKNLSPDLGGWLSESGLVARRLAPKMQNTPREIKNLSPDPTNDTTRNRKSLRGQ